MIKNILFDQGGIILNIDYTLTAKAFIKLGAINFDEVYSQKQQVSLFDLYDTGKISSEEFRRTLANKLGICHVSNKQFDEAWNAMLLDLPIERLRFIETLKNHYKVFILSNANEIHMQKAGEIFEQVTGQPTIDRYFHKTYYSHLCGLRKPAPEFFQLVISENNLIPKETLFIDDSYQHIKGAEQLGIQTLYLPHEDILNILPTVLGGK